jgi:hypothetical protein
MMTNDPNKAKPCFKVRGIQRSNCACRGEAELLVDVSENEHHPIIVQQWTGGVAGDVLLRLSNWRCALNQGRLLQGSRREITAPR